MIKLLIRNRIQSVFGALIGKEKGGKVKKASLSKILLISSLLLISLAAVVFSIVSVCRLFAEALLPIGKGAIYYSLFILISITFVFFFSIFETKNEIFECKDNELLLSMPIKPRDIVLARSLVVLIYNYLTEALIMLPAIVVYGAVSHDIIGIIGGCIAFLFIPLLGSALASAVGYAVALISKKMRNKTLVTMVFSLAFLAVYFYFYFKIMGDMESFILSFVGNVSAGNSILHYVGSVALLDPLPLLVFAALSLSSAAVAYILISKSFHKIASGSGSVSGIEYKEKRLKQGSLLSALVKKEFRRFASSATYMLNSALGLVFAVVIGVLALVNKDLITEIGPMLLGSKDALAPFGIAALVMTGCMTSMSASALSLEGKAFPLLRSLPIPGKMIILAKAMPQIILSVPVGIIASVLIIIALEISPVFFAPVILSSVFFNIFSAFFGIVLNSLFPKFDFDNDIRVVKQGLSVFIYMFAEMAISVGVFVLAYFALEISAIASALIIFGTLVLISVMIAVIALVPMAKKIERL